MAKKLLLADDSVTIQKVVGISFANEDISITTVDNGDDALVKVRELRPDVVLADVVMPGKSGYEVCQGIKADPELRHIPVLLLTGTFEAFDEERATRIGAAGHVAKPFEAQTLVDRVKQLLGRAPVAAAPPAAPPPPVPESAAPANDDSFDFFDDDLSNENSRDTAIEGATPEPSLDDSLSLEGADEAFAFGDDDLESPAPTPAPPDATIAMIPDEEPPARPAPAQPGEDPALTTVDTAMFAGETRPPTPMPSAAPTVPPVVRPASPPEPPDDAFDFEFETAPPPPPQANAPAGPEDFAQATILDPKLGSNFAVSSSDLDSTFSPMPRSGPQPADSSVAREAAAPRQLSSAPIGALDLESDMEEPLSSDLLGGAPIPEPQEADLPPAVEAFEDDMGAEPAQLMDEERTPMAPLPGPVAEATPPPIPQPAARPPVTPRPAAMPAADRVADPRLSADALTERIAPALREGLHETLEKIAWESFGEMSERIVQEVVQRVEAVAWDVVPKLAEALIQEEIRKLKGGAD